MFDIKTIQEYLPHRYPFLMIDKVVEFEEKKRIVALKNVTINEPFFMGHFPGNPIMPGVLIVEAMAQTAGVLAFKSMPQEEQGKPVYFLGIDNVRFRKPVVPGDQLRLELEITKHRQSLWGFKGKALVDGKLVAEAELLAMLGDEK